MRFIKVVALSVVFAVTSTGYCAGDGGLEAESQGGKWLAKGGRRGGALQVDTPKVKVSENLPAVFSKSSGTVHFLYRIDENQKKRGNILSAGNIELSWLPSEPFLQFRLGNKAVKKTVYDWLPGEWHHIALVWRNGVSALYLDGSPGSDVYSCEKTEPVKALYLGAVPGKVSFDEIMTEERAVAPDEVSRIAEASLSGKVTFGKPILSTCRVAKAPKVDGVLEPDEWNEAAQFSNFYTHDSNNFSEINRLTKAWISWDDNKLYMAFKIPVFAQFSAEKKARDKMRFGNQTVEIFLQPNPSGELEYYQLAFDPAGNMYDGRIVDPNVDVKWNVASRFDDQWWTAEVSIPYGSIEAIKPEDGARWQMNLVCAGGQWSPSNAYHDVTRFGTLKFANKSPVPRFDALQKINDMVVLPFERGGSSSGQPLTVTANLYPASGITTLAKDRTELKDVNGKGEFKFPFKGSNQAYLELCAFVKADKIIYQRYIKLTPSYFKEVRFFKDFPESEREPQKTKTTGTMSVSERKQAEQLDYRPTVDEIEKLLVEQQKWLNNDIGMTPLVPAPWTPMKTDGFTVTCLDKKFDFEGGVGLPRQVTVMNEQILAAPVRLESKTDSGKSHLFIKEIAEDHVTLLGTRRAGDVQITLETRVEFDGFMKHILTLAPLGKMAEIDGLELRIPYKPEQALYYFWWGGNAYGRTASETANFLKDDMKSPFQAQVWAGDDKRGYCWFSEAPENWSHPDDSDIISFTKAKSSVDLCVTFLKGKTVLDKPRTIVFGSMATPAKPRPAGWRAWEGKMNQNWSWYTAFSTAHKPRDPKLFREQVKDPFHHIMLSCYFSSACFLKDGKPTPEQWLWGALWKSKWNKVEKPYGPVRVPKGKHAYNIATMSMGGSWPDYYMYKLKQLREDYGIRSVYLDTCVSVNTNPFDNMTWKGPDGTVRGKVDIFNFRQMARRIGNFIHQDPEAFVMMHHSNQVAIPILSFVDTHMNGEHFNTGPHQVSGRNYSDVCPPGTLRACYTLKQWGVVPMFLPEHPQSTRGMLGYFWAHDMTVYKAWCNHGQYNNAMKAKRSFGCEDVDFIGYWDKNPPAEPLPEKVYVSAYRKKDGSAVLLIIANTLYEDSNINVHLRPESLGIDLKDKTISGKDIEWGTDISIKDGSFTIPVRGQDFRMIRIDKK